MERVPLRVHRFLAGAAREHRAVPAHQVCSAFSLLGSLGEMLSVIRVSGPICCCDFTNRIKCSCRAAWRFTKCDRIGYRYSHLSPGGNSVLFGAKETNSQE